MPLITLDDVSIAFGLHDLLDHASLTLEPGERVCLIGRNGAGKSTLLKILDGTQSPDSGQVRLQPGIRVARLTQEVPFAEQDTVFDVVAGGLAEAGELLARYHDLSQELAQHPDERKMKTLEDLQHRLEAVDGWRLNQRVEAVLTRLALPPEARIAELSGGWRRRVALGRVLVGEPDLLLLDEPTNHLDIDAIQWLEEEMAAFRGGLLFVTHDRALLRRLATRIVELDRGRLTSWPGDYERFLERKAAALEAEERQAAEFDKKLAQEEAWIRQGIKARRTRNMGRVRALKAMREERRQRREQEGRASFNLEEAAASGKLVAEAEGIDYAWEGKPVVRNLSIRIMRGDRIGLIGPNGCGKTTVLNLLLGRLQPDSGTLRQGTKLEVAYFDQLRAQLDPELSVVDNVAEGRDFIEIDGKRRHIIGYLEDFLFTAARARTPVKSLSGGERNRLLLARLFSQPANLLVMDEPTNDLDLETLELLEDLLAGFQGTLLLVSHDRAFLDNVVTSTLAFEGEGRWREYVGGYGDWLLQRKAAAPAREDRPKAVRPADQAPEKPADKPRKTKLSYKDQRELDQLPARIETLEAEQAQLQEQVSEPDFYKGDQAQVNRVLERLQSLEADLEAAYTRWDELESLGEGNG